MFEGFLTTTSILLQFLLPVLGPDVRPLPVYWEKFYNSTGGYLFVERLLDKFWLFFRRQSSPEFIERVVIVRVH